MAEAYLKLAKKGLDQAVRGAQALAQTLADEGGAMLAGSKALKDYRCGWKWQLGRMRGTWRG